MNTKTKRSNVVTVSALPVKPKKTYGEIYDLAKEESNARLKELDSALPSYVEGLFGGIPEALFAARFLLEWMSQDGTEPVDGKLAAGLASVITHCAREASMCIAQFHGLGEAVK